MLQNVDNLLRQCVTGKFTLFRVTRNSGIPADGNLTEINCTYRNCLTSVNHYRNGIVALITVFTDVHLRGNSGVLGELP